ncbi:ornithine cyclodeaminase family protein [Phaeovulum sp. W22_SRMD_FR3]|uniref:ornithine cyclodeaminase family protein n=1 Tax=Phaeovulum sp. W22_SRMD_FR3 TaxID=3240274 RepID=UPI003F9B8369
MLYLSEDQTSAVITHDLARSAVRAAMIAVLEDAAHSFPVLIGHASDARNRFTLKSASDARLAGVKVGSYFPSNDAAGLPRHSSTTLLFDQTRGEIGAVVQGGHVNAYRTAAANAVATEALSRPPSSVIALFGTGNQAGYEVEAVARIRPITRVLVVGRSPEKSAAMVARLAGMGLNATACGAQDACAQADIIITATTARGPLFAADWVRAGTHISAMGADAPGKQELPLAELTQARLFCDLPAQSRRIGEYQHAAPDAPLTALGAVLSGTAPGRQHADEITIFDSSGISLQDLYIAEAVIAAHLAAQG